jgi:hypothetical protein
LKLADFNTSKYSWFVDNDGMKGKIFPQVADL